MHFKVCELKFKIEGSVRIMRAFYAKFYNFALVTAYSFFFFLEKK